MGMYKLASLKDAALLTGAGLGAVGVPAAGLYAYYKGGKKHRDKKELRNVAVANAVPAALLGAAGGHYALGGKGKAALIGAGLGGIAAGGLGALAGASNYALARGVRTIADEK